MTSRERMLAALRLQTPDRVPIQVRGVRCWDPQWVATRHSSYRPVIEAVSEYGDYESWWQPPSGRFLSLTDEIGATARHVERTDWTETITTIHTPGGDLQTRHLTSKRGLPGMVMEYPVKTPADVEKVLSVPYVPLRDIDASGLQAERRRVGDHGIVMIGVGNNPVGHVHDLLGSELLAIWSIEHRQIVLQLIDVFLQRILDRVEQMLTAGLGPVFSMLGQEYVTPPLHSEADFRQFCVVPEERITEKVRRAGGIMHVHSHGPLDAVLEDFIRIADALHPIEAPPMGDVPLADAKRRIGGYICIEGNVQIGDVYALPTAQLVDRVKRAIDDAASGGGFILAPTASPHTEVLDELTVRNYVAMVETAAEYGG